MISTIAVSGALAKRLVEEPPNWPNWKLPSYAYIFFVGDFFLFLPVLLIIGYTFNRLYPTLAAIEDPLPAYEAVPISDDGTPKDDNDPVRAAQPGKPVTSSLRATHRLLRSVGGGGFSSFRGFGYAVVVALLTGTTTGFFTLGRIIPLRLAHLLALLAIAPLSTTWTHLVITPISATPFFRRIPPVRKVYAATWLPTVLLWLASHAAALLPIMLARLIGLPTDQRWQEPSASLVAQFLCVSGVAVGLQVLLVVPAHAALTRVQASLLPADEDTVVPFDRSFGGRVEPEVVSGKGFATLGAALATIPVRSWVRIYLLRVKVFAVSMAVFAAMGALLAGQVLLLRKMCDGKDGEGVKGYKCY